MSGDTIDDASIIERLQSLPNGDRAANRTNPFAIAICSGELITADEVVVAKEGQFAAGFRCPKCKGGMRHYTSKSGTPYFAHASARGNCPAGNESPAHLCIKRGLHSVGFDCEVTDDVHGYRWDAVHGESGVVVEVVCSGTDRYRSKISRTALSGVNCWWLLDSASHGLCSRWGTERVCLTTFAASGTVVVEGLFSPKVFQVFSCVDSDRLFAFYLGLIWRSVGDDRWQLLSEQHPLSLAAVAEDGIKHLMVKMHQRNAHVVTENKRIGVDRKTWFDRKFRFRGEFSTTWSGDRDYILGMIRQLLKDIDDANAVITKHRKWRPNGLPRTPVHTTAEDVIARIKQRHSVSVDEIAALRKLAEQSRVTCPLGGAAVASATTVPLVLDDQERRKVVSPRLIISSRWRGEQQRDVSSQQQKRIDAANRKLLEIAAERQHKGMPAYYLNNY